MPEHPASAATAAITAAFAASRIAVVLLIS
jgi:hypothetical protein